MIDASTSIEQFLAAAAAKQPAPGGGSAAALAGALAASMGEMTVNYSVGKKNLAPHEPELRDALAEYARARRLLLQLMLEDQVAYEALTAARKLPESSPARQADFDVALLASIRVPQAMGATALAVLELADRLVDKVNPFLLSDLAVSCELAMATVRCAVYNVRANLPDVTDSRDRTRIEATGQHLLTAGTDVVRRAVPRIWMRHAKSQGA
ncbi:MAG TPA: cyclodeaminase/cyclohydrolase family protein [Tepidisphaeraceae bacterium]|nr:cyclodeaminase/cyclohydrolase family protein [Tepidisphaeraceae bacterium]